MTYCFCRKKQRLFFIYHINEIFTGFDYCSFPLMDSFSRKQNVFLMQFRGIHIFGSGVAVPRVYTIGTKTIMGQMFPILFFQCHIS